MSQVKYIGSSTLTIHISCFSAPRPLCEETERDLRASLKEDGEVEACINGAPAAILSKSELDTVLCALGCPAGDLLAEVHQKRQLTLDKIAAVIADGSQPNSSSMPASKNLNRLVRLTEIEEDKQQNINRLTATIAQLTINEKQMRAKVKRLYMDERELQQKLQHLVARVSENQQRLDQSCLDRQETQQRLQSEEELFDME